MDGQRRVIAGPWRLPATTYQRTDFSLGVTQPKPPSGHVHRSQSQHSQLRWMWPSARAQIHHCPAQVGPSRALHHRHSRLALHEAAAGIRSMLEHRQGQVPQHHKCPLRVPHTGGRIRLGAGMWKRGKYAARDCTDHTQFFAATRMGSSQLLKAQCARTW